MLPERSWPFAVRPGSFETVDSFLRRLRAANLVTDLAWGAWVKPTVRATGMAPTDALPLIAEAVAGLRAGHFARDRAALPRHDDGETCANCATGLEDRFACTRCHPGERVEQARHDGPRVCRKHMTWVGPGTPPDEQYSVGANVLRADRLYRRLRRQGLFDAHRLAEVLDALSAWADASDLTLDPATRFTFAVRFGQDVLRPHIIDAYAFSGVDAATRYAQLSSAVAHVVGTDDCIVLTDALWLLIRAAGHQDQMNPHAFMCTAKEENVDERDELDQLRSSAYPRGRHRHLTQFVSSGLPGTSYAREQQMSKQNSYVCARGHRFVQRVQQLRTAKNGVGCGVCSNKYLLRGFNSLADTDPHLIPLWHDSKNGGLRPEDLVAGSETIVFWRCEEEGHEYDMMAAKKKKGVGCPYCANKRVDRSVNAFSLTHPDAAATWHWGRNGDRTPDHFVAGASFVAWWLCETHGEYRKSVWNRVEKGHGCSYCSGQRAHPSNSLAVTHADAARRWHPSRNGTLTASDVLAGSRQKAWWLCDAHGHHFYATVESQSRGNACNICTGRVVDEQNCMRTTRPDLARDFHPTANAPLTPDNVLATTTGLITWVCENAHEWVTSGANRARQGTGCPYCSNFSCWPGWNDLATTRPDLLADWDWENNGELTPQGVVAGTNKRIAWKCAECEHRWATKGSDRAGGSGCPQCYRRKPRRRRS